MDDFYERSRDRAEGMEGEGARESVVGALIGVQLANPSLDGRSMRLAEGLRFGLDAGMSWRDYDMVRTRLWADVLRVQATGEGVYDVTVSTNWFQVVPFLDHGLHLSAAAVAAGRTELEPGDLAEMRLTPYWLADVQAEVAPTGPGLGKDAFLAVPIGLEHQTRWTSDGAVVESRRDESVAIAARGFPEHVRHHLQVDFGRITRSDWSTPRGSAGGWAASLGYQRLSPGIEELTLWLLFGYGWYEGHWSDARRELHSETRGVLEQVGAEYDVTRKIQIGGAHELRFELDPRDNALVRIHEGRLFYRQAFGPAFARLGYEGVSAQRVGFVHAVVPELGVAWPFHPSEHRVELDAKLRLAWSDGAATALALDAARFQVSLDAVY